MKIQRPQTGSYSKRTSSAYEEQKKLQKQHELRINTNPLTNGTFQGGGTHLNAISCKSYDMKKNLLTSRRVVQKPRIGPYGPEPVEISIKPTQDVEPITTRQQDVPKKLVKRPQTAQPNVRKSSLIKSDDNYVSLQKKMNNKKISFDQVQDCQNIEEPQNIEQEILQDTCSIYNDDNYQDSDNLINQKTIKQEELTCMSTASKIDEMLRKYPDYYLHQSGKCICYTCECLQNCQCTYKKLLIKIIPNYQTNYKFDFKEKNSDIISINIENQQEILTQKLKFDSINLAAYAQTNKQSVMNEEFQKPKNTFDSLECKKNAVEKATCFSQNLTSYKMQFSQVPTYPNVRYENLQKRSLMNQDPLKDKSEYKARFVQNSQTSNSIDVMTSRDCRPKQNKISYGYDTNHKLSYRGNHGAKIDKIVNQNCITNLKGSANLYKTSSAAIGKIQWKRCKKR